MRITRVYTRTGDKGDTRLVGGRAERKDAPRIEAYGTVDELNSVLGLARTFNTNDTLEPIFQQVQNDLFNVGTELATLADDRWEGMYRVGSEDVDRLEHWIDTLNDELEPLKEFILPGGGPVGGFLHQARTVCRRGERRVVTLIDQDASTSIESLTYLNRLSDLLFVMARWAARAHGEPEFTWENPSTRSR